MTRFRNLNLRKYGEFAGLSINLGDGLTVVYGSNEAGKSTARDALVDFLCGIPTRSPRASSFKRPQLLIEADVFEDGSVTRWERRSSGLKQVTDATPSVSPWNQGEPIDRNWWSARFALNHDALRRGGEDVLRATRGENDIGELIFVARRGEFARNLLEKLTEKHEAIYRKDGRAKSVTMRKAMESLKERQSQLQASEMSAGHITKLRDEAEKTAAELEQAKAKRRDAERALREAEDHSRVISHVLSYWASKRELDELVDAGPRLQPGELERYRDALESRRTAQAAAREARAKADELQTQIEQLEVDTELLAAEKDIGVLHRDLTARLEKLDELDDHYLPEAKQLESDIRERLMGLGVSLDAGLESALDETRVHTDTAATLDELATSIEDAERARDSSRDSRQRAVAGLSKHGIAFDPESNHPISEAAVGAAGRSLREARKSVADLEKELAGFESQVTQLEEEQDRPPVHQTVTRQEVSDARASRDTAWSEIRDDWTAEAHLGAEQRNALADRFTALLVEADETSDREAEQRARVSAHHAISEEHDNRLRSLRRQVERLAAELGDATAHLRKTEEAWASIWAASGVQTPPEVDDAKVIVSSIVGIHADTVTINDQIERLAEMARPWATAASEAGLPSSATPAAWRARSDQIRELGRLRADLAKNQAAIAGIRQKWDDYQAQALKVLASFEPDARPQDQHEIRAAVQRLHDRLNDERKKQIQSSELEKQRGEQLSSEREASRAELQAKELIEDLKATNVVDDEELALMAERAESAAGPLHKTEEAVEAIRTAWPGAVPQEVIEQLREHDHADIEADLIEGRDDQASAQAEVEYLSNLHGSQEELLKQAESKQGADEILEQVSQVEAEITSLAEEWVRLRIQTELLSRVVESQGKDGVSPLLHEAGRILEHLTGGRWVALRPKDGHGVRALQVVRADEDEATPEKLSEGTLDQVYLALRLAAVRELHQQRRDAGKPALPLVLDDVLMAFDSERTSAALEALAELAEDIQIVLFTHHAYVADHARGLAGVTVSELPTPGAIEADRDAEAIRAEVPVFAK